MKFFLFFILLFFQESLISKTAEFSTLINKVGVDITLSLMKEIKSNILLSPQGIYSSLELLYIGASTETKTELKTFLYGVSNKSESILQANKLSTSNTKNKTLWFSENAIFYSHDKTLLPSYKQNIRQKKSALLLPLNTPKDTIFANSWIKDKTHNMIKSLVSDHDIGASLLISNVNYFYGKWRKPFVKEMNHLEKFYNQDKSSSNINMMEQVSNYSYLKNQYSQMVEIPYIEDNFSAVIILPNEQTNILKTISNISYVLKKFDLNSQYLYGNIQIPLFTIDNEFTLKNILSDLGLSSMFSFTKADFTNMFTQANEIHVDNINHRAILKVNENGSEATSLTKISFIGGLSEPKLNFMFKINRPFIFLIRNKQTKTLLYIAIIQQL